MSKYQKRIMYLRNEALDSLYKKPAQSTMLERLRILKAADEEVSGMPQALQQGYGSLYIAKHASKPVSKHDILLCRIPEEVPDEEGEQFLTEYIERYPGIKVPWQSDGGHTTFGWDELVEQGISGLYSRAHKKLEQLKAEGAEEQAVNFMLGKTLVYEAYITYIKEYAEAAEAAGMHEEADMCRFIAENPPETFRQSMQLILFVGNFFSIYTTIVSALSYGRLDQILEPYYLRDIENGIMSRDDAMCIIEDFYCKNNLILGRGEHQMAMVSGMAGSNEKTTGWLRNPVYDSPQYVVLAGYPDTESYKTKKTPINQLTRVFFDAFNPRFKNPVLVYRHSKGYDPEVYDKLCRLLLDNASILNYNDETMIPAYLNVGFEVDDAVSYTVHACNWPDVPGKYVAAKMIRTNVAKFVREAILDKNESLRRNYDNIDELYSQIFDDFRAWIKDEFDSFRSWQNTLPNINGALSHADCFMNDTADNIYSIYAGGIKYTTLYNQIQYTGSGIDAVIAVDQLVFKEKKLKLEELAKAMAADFEGYEDIRIMCRNAAKYGDDSDLSNHHVNKLVKGLIDIAEHEAVRDGKKDVLCYNTVINDNNHRNESHGLGATTDGRKRNELLSENISPASRIKKGSLTALLNSVTKLPFDHICCGALNVKVKKSTFKGDNGLELFKNVMDVFFEEGGMQAQWSIVDTAELRDAQQHPEKYRDLLVRVTGYSAIFVDMSKVSQEEMIIRSEMG